MKSYTPLYSVLIPLYRTDPVLLSRCLKSILDQKREDVQIVLVEALSDGQSSFQKTFFCHDPHISYVISEKASAPFQRNLTLAKAQGQYLVFVDSDDYISPDFFSFADRALLSFPTADLIVFNHTSGTDFYKGAFSASDFVFPSNHLELEKWFSCFKHQGPDFQGRSVWEKIFRKSIVDQFSLRFDLALPSNQDHFFVMHYLNHCERVAVAEKYRLYHFDISPFSMSPQASTNSPERVNAILEAWQAFFKEEEPSEIRKLDWAYNVVGFYIPRMMNYYFCSPQETRDKKALRNLFVQTLRSPLFRNAIKTCHFSCCLNRKKRFQLLLLKMKWYSAYFNLYWKLYKK
jgi:glycosyltransferase involved in cell wall biosynthesis